MPTEKLSSDQVTGPESRDTTEGNNVNPAENFFPTDGTADRTCEGVPEIKVEPCNVGTRSRRNGRAKKRPAMRTGTRLIQIVLSGAIGLAAGGFVLFLVNPDHPLILSILNAVHGERTNDNGSGPSRPESQTPDSPKATSSLPPTVNHNYGSTSTVPNKDPRPAEPVSSDAPPEEDHVASLPKTVPLPSQTDQEDAITVGPKPTLPSANHKTIVLNFSKSRMRSVLSTTDDDADVAVKIIEVVGLNTPYVLEPKQELVDRKQSVDIVLPDHAVARIRVALRSRQEKRFLEVTPEIKLTKNKWVPLTQDRLKGLHQVWTKKKQDANLQLANAKNLAANLAKAVRNADSRTRPNLQQRLNLLNQNGIPQIEQNIKTVEQNVLSLQRLSELLKQIDDKAEIRYVVQSQH